MKVLQIANGYLDKKLYANLFNHLDSIGVENQVFVPVQYGGKNTSTQKDVRVVECFSTFDRYLYFPKQKKTLGAVYANYNVHNLDLIHAHTLFSTGYTAYKLNKEFGIPYVVAVRNTDVNLFFNRMIHLRRIGVSILEHSERIIFLSPAYAESVVRKFVPEVLKETIVKKIEIIPNGIDDFFFQNIPDYIHKINRNVHLVHVGDIDKNKNITNTIEAINLLVKEGREIDFTLVGEITDAKLKQIVDETVFVKYHEKCQKEHVLSYLRDADILVMPSYHETFGLVYAEAMSQGLPVIYTKGQGFDGQFKEGHVGYHVDPKDPVDIAEKIEMVLDNYEQLSSNCISSVGKFDWKQIAKQYESVYMDVLKQASD
jgi:glycosyltransferase involved in cell wall biosynthesis